MSSCNNPIFHAVPGGKPSWRAAFHEFCEEYGSTQYDTEVHKSCTPCSDPTKMSVGIIGGGIAGLYSALILKENNIPFHIFEANRTRIGGRIYTHRFNCEENQYFEGGAMRLPEIPEHKGVFNLIDYVNQHPDLPEEYKVELMPFYLSRDDNLVHVNGKTMTKAQAHCSPLNLGFGVNKDPGEMMQEIFKEIHEDIHDGGLCFKDAFKKFIEKYDNYSMRSYLLQEKKWPESWVDFVETMTGNATNGFAFSLTESFVESYELGSVGNTWVSIKNGMDRLPNACRKIIGEENISMGAKVWKLEDTEDGKVLLYHSRSKAPIKFDRIIAAVPPGILRSIQRPKFSVKQEIAIRSLGIIPIYKIGLRFKTRFWEKFSPPSLGGESVTDNPTRTIVYPPFGIGTEGPGTLLLYCAESDALHRASQSEAEQEQQALRDLSTVYGEDVIHDNFIESKAVSWTTSWAQGLAQFYPGQFRNLWYPAKQPYGNYFFAGEHLSVFHGWIIGGIDSALFTCKKLLNKDLSPLGACSTHSYDYSGISKGVTLQ